MQVLCERGKRRAAMSLHCKRQCNRQEGQCMGRGEVLCWLENFTSCLLYGLLCGLLYGLRC